MCEKDANKVFYHWTCLPLKSSSIEIVFHLLSTIEILFHWRHLPFRLYFIYCLPLRNFSIEVVYHCSHLPLRLYFIYCLQLMLSSIKVIILWGNLPLRRFGIFTKLLFNCGSFWFLHWVCDGYQVWFASANNSNYYKKYLVWGKFNFLKQKIFLEENNHGRGCT